MKVWAVLVVLLQVVGFVAANWSSEDYEIFGLNDKIRQDLGLETTFYSWLDVSLSATVQEIAKAYRKKSRSLHPDKFKGTSKKLKKQAEERFQRLSLVGNILRDQSLRRRYDYFLAKGFPKWKGTGYYYSKFRPGVLFTFFVVYLLVCTAQIVGLKINRKQDFKRVAAFKESIKRQAWGGLMLPPADGSDRKVVNEVTGKQFLVHVTGDIDYIETDDRGKQVLIPLDEHDINTNPGFKESFFYKIPCGLWNVTLGKFTKTIDTTVVYKNPNRVVTAEEKPKKKKKGEKIELPNGKTIYSRKRK